MPTQAPGNLTASRVATLPGGIVAEVVLNERTAAFARWHADGAWSAWLPVADGVRDVSIAPDASQPERAALISVVGWVRLQTGAIAADHVAYRSMFFRLTVSGLSDAGL